MNNQFTYPKEKIRFAILTFFFAQGLCMASWASRIPDFKDVFAANYAFYWGLILFMIPVGKFVAIPLAGYLVSRLGSRTMVQVSILVMIWLGVAPVWHYMLISAIILLIVLAGRKYSTGSNLARG